MPVLDLNLNDFPDVVPPIHGGIYTMDILKTTVAPTKAAVAGTDPGASNLVVELSISQSHGNLAGRKRTDYISTKMGTRIRRLWQSAGLPLPGPGEGMNTDLLAGKSVRAVIKTTVIPGQGGARPKEVSDVDDYLIPADAGYAVA
jgi:hypothetical protein